ncbi:MAG TPA: M56 family metallopeptidase [Gemmataceae bacterium]|nr:M56 family metallopeptidase [Gemmataceae bacterium]
MQTFLEITLTNIGMATALALVAAVVGRLTNRPALSHFLWLLVLLKLVTPPLLPVRVHLPAAWEAVLTNQEPAANAPDGTSDQALAPDNSCMDPLDIWRQSAEEPNLDGNFILPELIATNPHGAAAKEQAADVSADQAPVWQRLDGLTWVGVIWLSGAVLCAAVALVRVYRFQRLLQFGRPAWPQLQAQAGVLATRMGLARCPQVWIVPGRISPLLWAAGRRARLVLPAELLCQLQPDQQATLLAHELAHARRRDHWVRWLELLVTSFYWWLPLAWWARRQVQEAEEQCCDAWVVWMLPAAAKAYARALLQTVEFLDARPALPPAASGVGHLYLLKRRLTMIVHHRLSPHLPWPVHVGTVLLGMLILPVAPQRLVAQTATTDTRSSVAATVDDEDDPPARSREQPQQLRDLERRMDRLEQRLDRAIRALERRGAAGAESPRQRGREMTPELAEKIREAQREAAAARERAFNLEMHKAQKAGEAQKSTKEKTAKDSKKEFRFNFDTRNLDVEKLKDLDKRIEDMVNRNFSPERMKEFEKQIEEAVSRNVNPERMKDLEKQIQDLVHRTLSPERMQAMQRQIEAAVARSMAADQRERARQADRAKAAEKAEAGQKQQAERPRAGQRGNPEAPRARDTRDLERRLDQLEQKMDRLLRSLEARERSNKESP